MVSCIWKGYHMIAEPMTLYKLMTLYMLNQVNFPLTNSQLSDFFISHEYTIYTTLQQALSELCDSGLAKSRSTRNITQYEITDEGMQALSFFAKDISSEIINDMDSYIKDNKFRLRSEVNTIADYNKINDNDYLVQCKVTEGTSCLIDLSLTVQDEKMADEMCLRWKECSQAIYSYTIKKLLGEDDI